MRNLPLPDIDHRDLFRVCAQQTRPLSSRQVLLSMTDRVVDAGATYLAAAQRQELHEISPIQMSDDEQEILRPLYNRRMAATAGSGRPSYDQIRASSAFCPYCSFGEVSEVDHFLPQGTFSELNVLPINLIPICHRCNHIKLEFVPQNANQTLLHPYFDILPRDERWIFAEIIIKNDGPMLHYRVELNNERFGPLSSRLSFHFERLQLNPRFGERSATVLAELEADIELYLSDLGPEGIMRHFQNLAARTFRTHGNTLEAAAYFAASESEDYCQGAWRN